MFTRFATTALCLVIVVGCSKKSSTPAGKSETPRPPNPQAAAKAEPSSGEGSQGRQGELAHRSARRGGEESVAGGELAPEARPGRQAPGAGREVVAAARRPPSRWRGAEGRPASAAGRAARRRRARPKAVKPVTEADMKEVWIFIENASGASGKMPPPAAGLRGAGRRRSRRPRNW